jgi:hypothetical protein
MMEPLSPERRRQAQKDDRMELGWREARWCRTGPQYECRRQPRVAHPQLNWSRPSELEAIFGLGGVPPVLTYLESVSSGSSS